MARVIQWFKGKPPAKPAAAPAAPARSQARTRRTGESIAPAVAAEQRAAPDTVGPENGNASTDVLLAQKLPQTLKARQLLAMETLVKLGVSAKNAAAMIGNFSQESLLKSGATSDRGEHVGIGQWDRDRQQAFQQMFGYRMGSRDIPQLQQFLQQLLFAEVELWRSQAGTARQMARALGLSGKTRAFEELDERPGDQSFARRLWYAEQAFRSFKDMRNALNAISSHTRVTNSLSNSTRIGDVHVHTTATDPLSHAKAVRRGLSTQPLLDPNALRSIALSTTSVAG